MKGRKGDVSLSPFFPQLSDASMPIDGLQLSLVNHLQKY